MLMKVEIIKVLNDITVIEPAIINIDNIDGVSAEEKVEVHSGRDDENEDIYKTINIVRVIMKDDTVLGVVGTIDEFWKAYERLLLFKS